MMLGSLRIAAGLAALACPAHAADNRPIARPLDVSPSVGTLGAARSAVAAGNWPAALALLKAAEREEPRNADVHNLLAYSYCKAARPDLPRAFQHYKTALEIDPRHKDAHAFIGEAYLMDKRPAEAEQHLAELERICGNRACPQYRNLATAIAAYKMRN